MKYGFIIPVYKHLSTIHQLTEKLSSYGLPIVIVDDGNGENTKSIFLEIAAKITLVTVVFLEKNHGKGGAFAKGLEKAAELGLSHVFQIDADGQHDVEKVDLFLKESTEHPHKIICGLPEYNENAPKSRVYGRKISNTWAKIVTLSCELKDVLCGFRIYPVEPSLKITRNPFMNKYMGFDTEIIVRLYWKKIEPVFFPVKIIYPKDGISNFRIVKDNLHISWTFTRLFFGMIFRLPLLLAWLIKRRVKH